MDGLTASQHIPGRRYTSATSIAPRRAALESVAGLAALAILMLATGCSLDHLRTPERLEKGLVVILPGIEGRSILNESLARGLADGGVECGIEIFDWGTPIPGGLLINLADYERNKVVAQRLNNRIISYRAQHPHAPLHIVGHSGGGGLAIMAVERLPENVQVSTVVLLAPAISPHYDLRNALRRTTFGIFNYYSELDAVFLRAGTTVAGTIDRRHGQSAGAVGFQKPADDSSEAAALYRKLHQVPYSADMRWAGHFGGHTDWTHPTFVKAYLAPLITELSGPPILADDGNAALPRSLGRVAATDPSP
ncbi:MAG: alpha/beta fold hydrolase [Planctomycetia bacterium]|nr:MAG: alpha/beta fold hydrolase [Planctomycetia bacterium]